MDARVGLALGYDPKASVAPSGGLTAAFAGALGTESLAGPLARFVAQKRERALAARSSAPRTEPESERST